MPPIDWSHWSHQEQQENSGHKFSLNKIKKIPNFIRFNLSYLFIFFTTASHLLYEWDVIIAICVVVVAFKYSFLRTVGCHSVLHDFSFACLSSALLHICHFSRNDRLSSSSFSSLSDFPPSNMVGSIFAKSLRWKICQSAQSGTRLCTCLMTFLQLFVRHHWFIEASVNVR